MEKFMLPFFKDIKHWLKIGVAESYSGLVVRVLERLWFLILTGLDKSTINTNEV